MFAFRALVLFSIAHLAGCAAVSVPGAPDLADSLLPGVGNGGYDVQHCDLRLVIDPVANALEGSATLHARALHGLSSFNLDLVGLEVLSLEVNGQPAMHTRDGRELTVFPDSSLGVGAEFRVDVAWRGQPAGVSSPSLPIPVGWLHANEEVFVLSQPEGAAGIFPCNDHPLDKATYSFEIEAPAEYAVVANGTPGERDEREGGRVLHRFRSRDPMASYLVTVAVARLQLVESSTADGLPLRHWFPPSLSEEDRAPFDATADMIAFFSERFGPYPFEAFGAIVADAPVPGALETQTVPVYGRGAGRESVIAHELAHQWFGNSVSVQDWSELWLSEGFASYASWLWLEHTQGKDALEQLLTRMEGVVQSRSLGPPARITVERMFSGEVYVRGAFVLRALHEAVGDEVFFDILRSFHDEHRNGHATIADFMDLAAAKGGEAQRALLQAWLFDDQAPPLRP